MRLLELRSRAYLRHDHVRIKSTNPEREPIARGWRAYPRSGSQSREGGEHIPGAGANRARAESIYETRLKPNLDLKLPRMCPKSMWKSSPVRRTCEPNREYLHDGPIGRRTRGYILTTDPSDAGNV
eukprot:1189792-Prorocentrum_minimum.AAC.1